MTNASPYPGLRAFERDEDHLFFGRDEQVDQLLDKLDEAHFLAVLGTSGSGKSSLVRAGLLPALESGYLAGAGARWAIAELRPGDQPFRRLAGTLIEDTVWGEDSSIPTSGTAADSGADASLSASTNRTIEELEADLRRGSLALKWRLGMQPLAPGSRLLILVDQFEELFRYHRAAADDAASFVALLLGAATHPAVYVVITMRSEFLGDCALYPDLPEAINTGLFLIPSLTPEQMADAIELPARLQEFGGEVTPELVRALLAESGSQTDQLPLLQHALMRLWEVDEDKVLTLPEYQDLGNLQEILDTHVEEAYASLDPEQQRIAEVLFRGLTERGAGERDTRRPVLLSEVAGLAGVDAAKVVDVVEVFRKRGRSFVVPPAGTVLSPDSVLDITHEALIRQWRRLQEWTEKEAEQAELYERLEAAAVRHDRGGGALWIDPDLHIALKWRETRNPTSLWAARYGDDFAQTMSFLDKSRKARDDERAAESTRRRREIRLTRVVAVVSVLAFLLSAALAGWALYERGNSLDAAKLALEREQQAVDAEDRAEVALAATANALKDTAQAKRQAEVALANAETDRDRAEQATIAAEEAAQALEVAKEGAEESETRRTEELFEAQLTHASLLAEGEDYAAARSVLEESRWLDSQIPLGRRHGRDFLARHIETFGGSAQQVYEGAGVPLYSTAVSPDGRLLAAVGEDGTVVLFDVESGELLQRLEGHYGDVNDIVFHPSGEWFATGGDDGQIIRWSVPLPGGSAEHLAAWDGPDKVWSLAVSPDGSLLGSGGTDNDISLWDVATGELEDRLVGHTDAIAPHAGLAFSPSGELLASASYDNTARLWDVATGINLHVFGDQTEEVDSVAFTPDGRQVATSIGGRRIVLWEVSSGQAVQVLRVMRTG